ncbi:DUF1993 domain-containing protein [Enhygromyxa salina]|nr:DUF1993 domain-containing protein [Enhygromyxa salina]
MSLYQDSVVQMSIMLRGLEGCIDKAITFAEAKECSPDDFVGFRLAPDMRPFAFQVQAACDTAKFAGSRLAGVEAPAFEDTEKTIPELQARIRKTLAFLETLDEGQFAGAAEREIALSFLPGKATTGAHYLREFAQPNFYFHLTTAYNLLRSAGVNVGKRDYLTHMTLHDLES